MHTYLNLAESVLRIGRYTKLTGRHVQVTWSLKCNDFFFCHLTARKHSSRVGIPPFQLHLKKVL